MSEIDFIWPAPAKLNLFLHITGRRDDGYHTLQTVFQFLDVADELRFSPRPDNRIQRVSDLAGVPEASDLVVRAAQCLQRESGCSQGVDIQLDKRLPLGGGLGGGSSDAATTLVALNAIWGLGFDSSRLAELGVRLGADIPVFVQGLAAWAEGIGEELTPIELPEPWFVVLVPGVHVSTEALFSDPELTRNALPIKIRDFLAGAGDNAFEPLVRARYSMVGAALDWLDQFSPARLTGTGACVFASFDTEQQAREVAAQAEGQWTAMVAQGRNRSPLLDALERYRELTNGEG